MALNRRKCAPLVKGCIEAAGKNVLLLSFPPDHCVNWHNCAAVLLLCFDYREVVHPASCSEVAAVLHIQLQGRQAGSGGWAPAHVLMLDA